MASEYRLIWTQKASHDLKAIYDFIYRDSPKYASIEVKRLLDFAESLADFPYAGKACLQYAGQNLREKVLGHYRLIYRVAQVPHEVLILTVVHSSRTLPKKL